MNAFVAITDRDWFDFLAKREALFGHNANEFRA
jgi:hypothetical protein